MSIESFYRRKRLKEKKLQSKRIEEATDKLRELDTDQEFTPENVVRAIVDGFVPWVRFGGEK